MIKEESSSCPLAQFVTMGKGELAATQHSLTLSLLALISANLSHLLTDFCHKHIVKFLKCALAYKHKHG